MSKNFEKLLSSEEKDLIRKNLRELSVLDPLQGVGAFAMDWLMVFAAIYLSEKFFNPFIYILAVLFIGTRQHAIAILSHDAAHYRILNNRKWNVWLTNVLSSYPMFVQLEIYRLSHIYHHQHTNTEQDPDVIYQKNLPDYQFPMTHKKLLKIFALDFLGVGMIANFKRAARYALDPEIKGAVAKDLAETKWLRISFYVTLVALLTVFGGWKLFLMYWLLPLFWVLPAILRLRNISEHYGLSRVNELKGSRDVVCGSVEAWLLAPHNVHLHLVHHLYPSIPFYNLKAFHQVLMRIPAYRDGCHKNSTYLVGKESVWKDLTAVGEGAGFKALRVSEE